MVYTEFMNSVKSFLRMDTDVTMYDEELRSLIESALTTLAVAGVEGSKRPLVTDFVNTYVRVRMLQDASSTFRESEYKREQILIQQLVYGG